MADRPRVVPFVGRLLLELLVGFVGVYAAATLAQRQDRVAEAERRDALRLDLAEEMARSPLRLNG
jgi:hypothetical protein